MEVVKSTSECWVCLRNFNNVIDQNEKLSSMTILGKANFCLRNLMNEVTNLLL